MTTCAAATAACGPGAKMNLAYTTGPFSVPNCPARPSRTTEGLILYGAMGTAATWTVHLRRVTRHPARHYGSGRPGAGSLPLNTKASQEAACSRCAAQQDISGVPYR